jgi:hypothetical protein
MISKIWNKKYITLKKIVKNFHKKLPKKKFRKKLFFKKTIHTREEEIFFSEFSQLFFFLFLKIIIKNYYWVCVCVCVYCQEILGK